MVKLIRSHLPLRKTQNMSHWHLAASPIEARTERSKLLKLAAGIIRNLTSITRVPGKAALQLTILQVSGDNAPGLHGPDSMKSTDSIQDSQETAMFVSISFLELTQINLNGQPNQKPVQYSPVIWLTTMSELFLMSIRSRECFWFRKETSMVFPTRTGTWPFRTTVQ